GLATRRWWSNGSRRSSYWGGLTSPADRPGRPSAARAGDGPGPPPISPPPPSWGMATFLETTPQERTMADTQDELLHLSEVGLWTERLLNWGEQVRDMVPPQQPSRCRMLDLELASPAGSAPRAAQQPLSACAKDVV